MKYNSKINLFIHKICAFSKYNREVDFVQKVRTCVDRLNKVNLSIVFESKDQT